MNEENLTAGWDIKVKKKFYKRKWFIILVSIVAVWLCATLIAYLVNRSETSPFNLINLPEAEYRAQCEIYPYEDILRYPDTYNKHLAKFTGEVRQISRKTMANKLEINVAVTLQGEGDSAYYINAMYVYYTIPDGVNILEGDIITMYGELRGLKSFTNLLGYQVTVPRIYVKFIDVIG